MSKGQGLPDTAAQRGLQRERTVLAWNRTAISVTFVGLLLGRFAAANPFSPLSLPALLGVGTGVWVLWVTSFRPGGLEWSAEDNRLRQKRSTALAIITVALGVAAVVLVALGKGHT